MCTILQLLLHLHHATLPYLHTTTITARQQPITPQYTKNTTTTATTTPSATLHLLHYSNTTLQLQLQLQLRLQLPLNLQLQIQVPLHYTTGHSGTPY